MTEQRPRKPVWPAWVRVLVTLGVVLAFYKLYAGMYWFERVHSGKGVFVLSASGKYIGREPIMNRVVTAINEVNRRPRIQNPFPLKFFWQLGYAVGTMGPAALLGAFVYGLLLRVRGPAFSEEGQSRCRRCGHILHGLSKPMCPECGEAV